MRFSTKLFKSLSPTSRYYFVSTPIFYVNANPHIGHLYTAVIADAVQRFERLIDPSANIIFSTGTDEHGTKIQQAALTNKIPLNEYCTNISNYFKDLFIDSDVQFTDFIRTTEDRHKISVQHFWNELKKKDFIYSSKYSGWYCVSDETFLTESHLREEVRNGQKVKVSAESGHPVEWSEEKNYIFRLSALKSDLIYWLKQPDVIQPEKYRKIIRETVEESNYLADISISRPSNRVHWAIPVPDDNSQSVYVWLDALINYLTVIGYPDKSFKTKWPCDVHVVGKDILKFHAVYWPAFLMAVGLNPPRKILCHGHWTVDDRKMSKSLHNVVDPRSTFGGLEALRYFLLREGTNHSDANYSEIKMIRILNSQLADTLGNLLNRCTGNVLNVKQQFPQLNLDEFKKLKQTGPGETLINSVESLPDSTYEHYINYNFYKAVDNVFTALHAANIFFEINKPWELKKKPEDEEKLNAVLHITMETLRVCGIILQPIVPGISNSLLDKLAVPEKSRFWDDLQKFSWNMTETETRDLSPEKTILFRKIDVKKTVAAVV